MSEQLLREMIRSHLTEARYVTLLGQNRSDLDLAILWLKMNRKLRSVGDIRKLDDDTYAVRIRVKGDHKVAANLVRDRFGYFVRVVL